MNKTTISNDDLNIIFPCLLEYGFTKRVNELFEELTLEELKIVEDYIANSRLKLLILLNIIDDAQKAIQQLLNFETELDKIIKNWVADFKETDAFIKEFREYNLLKRDY